jgi:dihydroorotase
MVTAIMRFSIFVVCASTLFAQVSYDLVLKGGHVIDPKNNISSVRDVAIRDGKIAAVAMNIPASQARKVVNVAGLYVTPGLIDLHAHVFSSSNGGMLAGGSGSIYPDNFALRVGVTTVVDAGSSGRRNFAQFKKNVIDRARTSLIWTQRPRLTSPWPIATRSSASKSLTTADPTGSPSNAELKRALWRTSR